MKTQEFLSALNGRASAAGIDVPEGLTPSLAIYFELLALWNQKINLTGFSLDQPTDNAIDRLFIEPLMVAKRLQHRVKAMVDIGSGGGSPAIPMALALSPAQTVLVEAKSRKAVFLKEVARALGLSERIDVRDARFEDLAKAPQFSGRFDLVTIRAVRTGPAELATISAFLESGGKLVLFRTGDETSIPSDTAGLRFVQLFSVQPDGRSSAAVMEKT